LKAQEVERPKWLLSLVKQLGRELQQVAYLFLLTLPQSINAIKSTPAVARQRKEPTYYSHTILLHQKKHRFTLGFPALSNSFNLKPLNSALPNAGLVPAQRFIKHNALD
jgi:hypothetical protein